jgi:hypothetical protein
MPRRVSWDSEVNVEEFVMHEKSVGQEPGGSDHPG